MKSLKNLLIPAIVLVVLIVASVLWFALKPSEEVVPEENQVTNVYKVYMDQIDSISVMKKSGDDFELKVLSRDDGNYVWDFIDSHPENDDREVSSDSVSLFFNVMSSYDAASTITSPSSLADYGLENPEYVITYKLTDGTTTVIRLGDTTLEPNYCYFMIEGDSNVYTCHVNKRVYAAYTYLNFLGSRALDFQVSDIATVTFDRTPDDTHFTAQCEILDTGSPVYTCIDPYQVKASAYFENLINSIVNLQISGFIDLSEDQLSEYGLDDPAFTFTFVLRDGQTVVIELSSSHNGMLYGHCSTLEEYFELSSMQIEGLETPILTLLSRYLTYYSVSDVSEIRCNYDDQSFSLALDVDSSITDENGTVLLDGRNALVTNSSRSRCYASVLYEALVCVDIGGIELDANPSLDSVMNIVYVKKDLTVITFDYVQRDADSYYVFIDGEYANFYVYSRELFKDGGEDTFAYGIWPAYQLCDRAISESINGIYDIPVEEA